MDSRQKLVILGCGYLGSEVAKRALGRNLVVTALTRNAGQAAELRRSGVQQVVEADLDSYDWHSNIDPRQDWVLNCVGSAGSGLTGYRKSYEEGMHSLLRWASKGRVGTVLFTSSTSVYGQNHNDWVTETDAAEGSSEGSRVLLRAETLLLETPLEIARRFVLRLGGIYGPGRHHLLDRAANGGEEAREGDDVFLNSIRVDDAAEAILAAFEARAVTGGIFNIVDNCPTRKSEILRHLRQELKTGGWQRSDTRVAPPRSRRAGPRPSRKISNAAARSMLEWEPAHPDYRSGYASLIATLLEGQGR